MNILADASLPGLTAAFPAPFSLSTYTCAGDIPGLLDNQEILLCRSTLKVNGDLLKNHSLKFLATASSGTDHIDHQYLSCQTIRLIDAKGSNASSVADYVVACLAWLQANYLIGGVQAGIIGMGRAGSQVFSRLKANGFNVLTYDPLKALREPVFQSCALDELYACDLLCIHAELHDLFPHSTFNLIDEEFLTRLKPACILINAARGGIVNEEALLHCEVPIIYCTDVYLNEPEPDKRIIDKATLCTPHIAGHSLEAKYAAVAFVSQQLHQIAGLPCPEYETPVVRMIPSRQEGILSLYNPEVETLYLKKAEDIKTAFLTLRQDHQYRHDFSISLPISGNCVI